MTFTVAGWRAWRDADSQGRDYWRAARNGYQCGAHTRRSLMTLCAGMPIGEPHRGTPTMQDLDNLDTSPNAAVLTDAADDDRRIA